MRPERVLAVVLAVSALFLQPHVVRASSGPRPTIEEAYRSSAIVCVADAIEFVPAPEATEATPMTIDSYRVRVSHVWKGDPPDTLTLFGENGRLLGGGGWSSPGGTPHLTVGVRYVIFANVSPAARLHADRHTGELATHAAELLWLTRNLPAPRPGAPNSKDLPDVSFNSLAFELETGDSRMSTLAAHALRQLADSSGALVPRLDRVLWSGNARWRREGANFVLGTWSTVDRAARLAILRALDRGDSEMRLLVLSTDPYYYRADEELLSRMFEHRENPNPEVRAAVLERAVGLLSSPYPPIRGYTDALRDPSRGVRLAAIRALRSTPRKHSRQVMDALERYRHDPDAEIASRALEVRAELMMRAP